MKKRTSNVFPLLLAVLLLLVGCRDSGQKPRAEWDQETYLVFANGTERRFLYGCRDGFFFGPLSYEVWFWEELLDGLSGPLTEEEVSYEAITDE